MPVAEIRQLASGGRDVAPVVARFQASMDREASARAEGIGGSWISSRRMAPSGPVYRLAMLEDAVVVENRAGFGREVEAHCKGCPSRVANTNRQVHSRAIRGDEIAGHLHQGKDGLAPRANIIIAIDAVVVSRPAFASVKVKEVLHEATR